VGRGTLTHAREIGEMHFRAGPWVSVPRPTIPGTRTDIGTLGGIQNTPNSQNEFVSPELCVNEWTLSGDAPYINTSADDDVRNPNENGYVWITAEVTDATSGDVVGQGPNAHPASLFDFHLVLDIDNKLYDPSYGKVYGSLQDFDDLLWGFYDVVETPTGDYEWTFTENSTDPKEIDVKVLSRPNL